MARWPSPPAPSPNGKGLCPVRPGKVSWSEAGAAPPSAEPVSFLILELRSELNHENDQTGQRANEQTCRHCGIPGPARPQRFKSREDGRR